MPISFLAEITSEYVQQAINQFSPSYLNDWQDWQNLCSRYELQNEMVAKRFGQVLRSWQAGRPHRMRRPRSEASHNPPYLDDLINQAFPHLRELSNTSLREINNVSNRQDDSLKSLWQIFTELTYPRKAACVGITKAIMLLTHGRIGPAFDKMVRASLGIRPFQTKEQWLDTLKAISQDIEIFETREHIRLEDLVRPDLRPIGVGRIYDMIAWGHHQIALR